MVHSNCMEPTILVTGNSVQVMDEGALEGQSGEFWRDVSLSKWYQAYFSLSIFLWMIYDFASFEAYSTWLRGLASSESAVASSSAIPITGIKLMVQMRLCTMSCIILSISLVSSPSMLDGEVFSKLVLFVETRHVYISNTSKDPQKLFCSLSIEKYVRIDLKKFNILI